MPNTTDPETDKGEGPFQNYNEIHYKMTPSTNRVSLIFSIKNKVGSLSQILEVMKNLTLNLGRIESRPSKSKGDFYDFFVDIDNASKNQLDELITQLNGMGIGIVGENPSLVSQQIGGEVEREGNVNQVPWFPRKLSDLDMFQAKVMEYGTDLDADHPGFTDPEYRKRRIQITANALVYKHGDKLPHVPYTDEENATWRTVYQKLTALYPSHACKQQNYVLPLLESNCGFGPNAIPQLEPVSKFLQDCTGWRLRPVTGLLSSRDFLNGLAFRVFHSTQYIRHPSKPLYTPEPDVCHELLGHVPLYADPDFAEFSQEIGLASLGASDEDIEKLATVYWFTVEFGVCKEGDQVKAYGAGLLSSFGELAYALGGNEEKPKYLPFDPEKVANTKYPITSYQPTYFVAESFADAKEKVIEFAATLKRPFTVRYNAYTQSIEVLDNKQKLSRFVKEIHSQIATLNSAIEKLPI
eukprot:TRINITY_DN1131_c0_g1_i1.p1 TRINITY_DN1131_c0_g1~~TRINITY_DN1131_c0_g1_i1.p1  ORF type:complete len:467 (-),score=164.51 TRINITY_DN1131_c0_g1_i1:70-1470(-)